MSKPFAPLFQSILAPPTLNAAWDKVRGNGGCAGGDGETIAQFQSHAAQRLRALALALGDGTYRPRDLRLIKVPKKDGSTRPLAIPSVQDRIAQTAAALVLGPVIDPQFADGSFGYRPGRSVAMAVRRISALRGRGFTHVVEADIVRCFERIPLDPVLERLDAALLGQSDTARLSELVGLWIEHAAVHIGTPGVGLAQGSPLSPLLANLYLDRLDDALTARNVVIVRFADDFVLLCRSAEAAHAALAKADDILGVHGLELHDTGTRVLDFDRGFDFLGHLFVRSTVLKRVNDPVEDPVEIMRTLGLADHATAADALTEATEEKAGYDRGDRVLYLNERGRNLVVRGQSWAVEAEGRELIGISAGRVDRIELGPGASCNADALRHALATGTDIAFVNGSGETQGWLTTPGFDRAGLHLAQAKAVLDPDRAASIARAIVDARLRNQRARLHLLNRERKLPDVIAAIRTLGYAIRKLPHATSVPALRGHEGAAAASYWPALGLLCKDAPLPFRRNRPATDGLNAAINYLTELLRRDIRAAVLRAGLHPGFGVLHVATDGHEACVWDLMEGFRAALTEGVAVTLFNQGRLRPEMIEGGTPVRLNSAARKALITGYEAMVGHPVASPHSARRRTWRKIMQEEATRLGQHILRPDQVSFVPYLQGY